ncbi:ferritin-like domain-containing protein [Bacillus cytotoxicus]
MNIIGTDSKTFVERIMNEVMEDQREKEEKITMEINDGEELPEFVIKHWLNFAVYYEKAATYFIGDWLKTTKEADALVSFAHQIEDEANHYVWLRKHLADYVPNPDSFEPPKEWRYLMEEYYPGLDHLVERLAAHNIASESAALGFMEFALERFPEPIRKTVEKVSKDELFHVSFGKKLLEKYCTTPELQERAYKAMHEAMEIMRDARKVFVKL